jgi:RNA polymerase sigma factor (sigma-70 family)
MRGKESKLLHEAQVKAQVRTGHSDAFGEIIEHYQRPIVRYLLRMTGNYEVAQDLAQDTFLQAFRGIHKTRSELSLKAWLYRIATNNANQYHRRRRLLSFIPFTGSETSDTPNMTTSSDQIVERMAMEEALLKVPQGRRVCMVLHFVEGLTYKEIGEIVSISEEAVRKRVARGSQDFRNVYNVRTGGDE